MDKNSSIAQISSMLPRALLPWSNTVQNECHIFQNECKPSIDHWVFLSRSDLNNKFFSLIKYCPKWVHRVSKMSVKPLLIECFYPYLIWRVSFLYQWGVDSIPMDKHSSIAQISSMLPLLPWLNTVQNECQAIDHWVFFSLSTLHVAWASSRFTQRRHVETKFDQNETHEP